MREKILIYSGTTEGRRLSEILAKAGVSSVVCVATTYGEWVMGEHRLISVKVGRQNLKDMEELMSGEEFAAVVDATHPYATLVTAQLKECAAAQNLPYLRLKRQIHLDHMDVEDILTYDNAAECAQALEGLRGNILLTTGSKDLEIYAKNPLVRERLYVRVLPGRESICACEQAGIVGRQILALQGPFSKEMNLAMIRQYEIRYLVTKESGRTGGLEEKLLAAREAGITACLIGCPKETVGMDIREVLKGLTKLLGIEIPMPQRKISLVGLGMGQNGLTTEGAKAIDNARYLFGASRLVKPYAEKKTVKACYLAKDILPCLEQLEEQDGGDGDVVVLFSGDTGFYSGAGELRRALLEKGYEEVELYPGISSVSALSAKSGVSWQDACLISLHEKERGSWEAEVLERIRENSKSILLFSDREQVEAFCKLLVEEGLGACSMDLGMQLSYPEEQLLQGRVSDFSMWLEELPSRALYTALLLNEKPRRRRLSYGWEESAFERGRVPMTKEEVRSVVLGKLRLSEGDVVCDIGSGTGSVAVEMAALSASVEVYAVECNEEACLLIEKNQRKHHCRNLHLVRGMAPEVLIRLPVCSHAFIGGSKGRLLEILEALYQQNPHMRVVITAIAMETISELTRIEKAFCTEGFELVQVQVARTGKVGSHRLMQGENPVTICSFTFGGERSE